MQESLPLGLMEDQNHPFYEIEPEMRRNFPSWFHPHGDKMSILYQEKSVLVIGAKAASLTIDRPFTTTESWRAKWELKYSLSESVIGTTMLSDKILKAAFAINDYTNDKISLEGSRWLLEKYGATIARQGFFIRYRGFLNIPGPGTGHDGDPNISIVLTHEMRSAIQSLLDNEKSSIATRLD